MVFTFFQSFYVLQFSFLVTRYFTSLQWFIFSIYQSIETFEVLIFVLIILDVCVCFLGTSNIGNLNVPFVNLEIYTIEIIEIWETKRHLRKPCVRIILQEMYYIVEYTTYRSNFNRNMLKCIMLYSKMN